MANGIRTEALPSSSLAESVLINSETGTGKISFADFSRQLSSMGTVSDRVAAFEAVATVGGLSYLDLSLSELSGRIGTSDGEFAVVVSNDDDAGVYERVSGIWTFRAELPAIMRRDLIVEQVEADRIEVAGALDEVRELRSQTAISEGAASVDASRAITAAQLAGTPLYPDITTALADVAEGAAFMVADAGGLVGYTKTGGAAANAKRIGEVLFDDVEAVSAFTGSLPVGLYLRTRVEGLTFEVVDSYGSHVTAGGDQVLRLGNVPDTTPARVIARVNRATQFKAAGSITILGDSITVGEGATDLTNSYASKVFASVADAQGGGYGVSNEVNFNWSTMGNVALNGHSQGTSGPIQRSMIVAVNGTITITRNCSKIGFFFDRTTASGSVEVRQNGVLLTTINCSGTAAKNVQSAYVNVVPNVAVQFKVITAPVEFLAMIPITDHASQPNVMMCQRMAVSGWNTTHFLADPAQLQSVSTCGSVGGSDAIFVLAIGTNDIYTASRTPREYTANLRTIGETLVAYRPSNTIVLTVPPIANETLHPPSYGGYTHADYRQAIYDLSTDTGWAVSDYSTLDLTERSLYADGIHPADRGHQEMAATLLATLGLRQTPPVQGAVRDLINALPLVNHYRKRADLTTFTGGQYREKSLVSMGVTSADFITGIYLRWKTSGVMLPIEHCQNFTTSGGEGIQLLRSFTGADYSVAKLFYYSPLNDGEGFAAAVGPLRGNLVAGYTDVEVIVEFIRSNSIQ